MLLLLFLFSNAVAVAVIAAVAVAVAVVGAVLSLFGMYYQNTPSAPSKMVRNGQVSIDEKN